MCEKHYRKELLKTKPECIIEGCERHQTSNGLCGAHNARKLRHGHLDPTRPHDWGAKQKHPLYHAWGGMRKKTGLIHIDQEWLDDFWIFVRDMGERPSPRHTLRLKKESAGYVKENAYWRPPSLSKVQAESRKEYHNAYRRRMNAENPEKFAGYEYKKRYGITFTQYSEMFKVQNGVCAICKEKEIATDKNQNIRRLAVDHCHETGKIRDLLCTNCNTLIGRAKDSVDVLRSAIKYLEKHSK